LQRPEIEKRSFTTFTGIVRRDPMPKAQGPGHVLHQVCHGCEPECESDQLRAKMAFRNDHPSSDETVTAMVFTLKMTRDP
jgi:hypothetical protein